MRYIFMVLGLLVSCISNAEIDCSNMKGEWSGEFYSEFKESHHQYRLVFKESGELIQKQHFSKFDGTSTDEYVENLYWTCNENYYFVFTGEQSFVAGLPDKVYEIQELSNTYARVYVLVGSPAGETYELYR